MDMRNALIPLFGATALAAGAGTVTCLNTVDGVVTFAANFSRGFLLLVR